VCLDRSVNRYIKVLILFLVSLYYYLGMPNDVITQAAADAVPSTLTPKDGWRLTHMGRLMGHALRRFDARVLTLMTHSARAPLALSNLAARGQVGAAIVHITRHLSLDGSRLSTLAASAGMTKQAMGTLVDQCEAWGLVRREPDALDARAKRIVFTPAGLDWLGAFEEAIAQAEAELRQAVGKDVATVLALGLEAYAHDY
jgi:DNA-binding MarR family transcriptional regulator